MSEPVCLFQVWNKNISKKSKFLTTWIKNYYFGESAARLVPVRYKFDDGSGEISFSESLAEPAAGLCKKCYFK